MRKRFLDLLKKYKQTFSILVLFKALCIVLLLLSLISALLITIFSGVLISSWNLSNSSFENLLNIYSFPVKSFAAFLALLTIYVTLKRMKATEQQIELTQKQIQINLEQNRISNYFKYRDEFVKHFESGRFHKFYRGYLNEENNVEGIYYPIFNFFYGSIKEFDHNIKDNLLVDIQLLYDDANKFTLFRRNDTRRDINTLIKYFHDTTNSWESIIRSSYFDITFRMATAFVNSNEKIKEYVEELGDGPFIEMMGLYFNILLLNELKAFAGIETKSAGTVTNSIVYLLNQLGTSIPYNTLPQNPSN